MNLIMMIIIKLIVIFNYDDDEQVTKHKFEQRDCTSFWSYT